MLRAGKNYRFTPGEVDEFRRIGIDIARARTQDDVEHAVTQWVNTVSDERPDLMDKIAAKLSEVRGVTLPARLTRVR